METLLDEKLNGGIGDLAASSFHQFGVLDLGRDVFCSDQLLHGNPYTGVMKVSAYLERNRLNLGWLKLSISCPINLIPVLLQSMDIWFQVSEENPGAL
jgi:hypothetical protein